jgi:hypothetical protein
MTLELEGRHTASRLAWEAEEKRKIDAKAAALLAPAQQALRTANKEIQNIWRTTPVEKWAKTKDLEYLAAVTPDLPELEVAPEGFFDDPEVATARGQEAKNVLDTFLRTLLPRTRGIVLSLADQKKFRFLVSAFIKTKDAVVTSDNLNRIFDWSVQGETIFNDFGYDESLIVAEPEPETALSVDTILSTVDTTTRSGNELLKQAVDRAWMEELSPLLFEWFEHMAKDHSVSVTKNDADYLFNPISGWLVKTGQGISSASLNACRLHMHSIGKWAGAIATSEYFDKKLQRGEITFSTWNHEFHRLTRAGVWARPLKEAQAKGLL